MYEFHTTPIGDVPNLDPAPLVAARTRPVDPALAPALRACDRAEHNLEALLDGALCVTTGQQPGLFTGPLFTIYKGLSAIALAESLRASSGRPVVPVFWVAGDDHDFAEANHCEVIGPDHALERIRLRERAADAPMLPLYREPLGPEVHEALARLTELTPDTEFRSVVLSRLGRHYHARTDMASAFADTMAELLGPLGLVVFSPTRPEAKRAAAPLLLAAAERAAELDAALAAHAARMVEAGRPAPVPVGTGASLVMIEDQLGRDRLVLDDEGLLARRSGERWSPEALRRAVAEDPGRVSANVLLRPVVEAAVLPTLAYVAGPGELAYLPQCEPVYRALGVAPQAVVPRWSAAVVEAHVAKVLEKFGLERDELASEAGALEARLLRDRIPDDAEGALAALRTALDTEYERLEQAAVSVDPTLGKPIRAAHSGAVRALQDVEKKLIAHLKKQDEIVVRQLHKGRQHLFPRGKAQERVLNVVPYLIRHGDAFLRGAYQACRSWYGVSDRADPPVGA